MRGRGNRGRQRRRHGGSEPLVTPEDRPRGILSPTDREYLYGQKEYAQPQTDANRRQAIRERVVNGLKDFELLSLLLEPESARRSSRSSGRKRPTTSLRRWWRSPISGLWVIVPEL